jgi:enoyl-CoA hydratase
MNTLSVTITGTVATVTLNRPEAMNAINAAMLDDLEQTFAEIAADRNLRAVLLTGAGERAFAAGADIRELALTNAATGLAAAQRAQQVFAQIESCGKPVIAALNGAALGGGLELALACTFRIASEKATLALPEVKLGLIPGYGGTQRLTRLLGPGQAQRLMLIAAVLEAPEAYRLRLVEEVVSPASLIPRATELADIIASLSPLGVAGVLESVRRQSYEAEAKIFGRLCATADKTEGLNAFLEKRKPVWQGK